MASGARRVPNLSERGQIQRPSGRYNPSQDFKTENNFVSCVPRAHIFEVRGRAFQRGFELKPTPGK